MEATERLINEIQNGVKTLILKDAAGNEFSTRPLNMLPVKKLPQPETLEVNTLTGFCEYVAYNEEDPSGERRIIQVLSHNEVRLLSPLYGAARQRDVLCQAGCEDIIGKTFNFGTYYGHEEFIVKLQALFVESDDRDKLLRLFSMIKTEQVLESHDDGMKQAIVARTGVATVAEAQVPNPVILSPYRTFREIAQPQSLFIVRVRGQKDALPSIALFEADGGQWKLEAITKIRDFLWERIVKSTGPKVTIIA
jgi:hypothetical protein